MNLSQRIWCSYMHIYLLVFVRICQYMLVFKARKSVSRIDTSIYVQNVHILTRYEQKYCYILAKPYQIRTLFLRFQNHTKKIAIYEQDTNKIRTKILAKPYQIRTLFLRFQNHIFLFDVRFASICSYF